jgi:hypothetical protein
MAVGAAKHMWRCEEACAADAAVADCAASAAVPTHAARRTRARRNRHSTAAGAFIAEADLRGGGRWGGGRKRKEQEQEHTLMSPPMRKFFFRSGKRGLGFSFLPPLAAVVAFFTMVCDTVGMNFGRLIASRERRRILGFLFCIVLLRIEENQKKAL